MTKLLDQIKVTQTGRREAILKPLSTLTFEESFEPSYQDFNHIYRVDLRMGARVAISDLELRNQTKSLEHAKDHIRRLIADEVYGEVRDKLRDVLTKMYYDGIAPHIREELHDIVDMMRG